MKLNFAFFIISIALSFGGAAMAQQTNSDIISVKDIAKLDGRLIESDETITPALRFDVPPGRPILGFRVEEVDFSTSRDVMLSSGRNTVRKVWKVTVTSDGSPFPVRSILPFVWINDKQIGVAVENAELSEMTVVLTDPEVLKSGGNLSFSFGPEISDRLMIAKLPEMAVEKD